MKRRSKAKGRAGVHITSARAARLHQLVLLLADGPQLRSRLLSKLGIGLRTFYREVALLARSGVRIRLEKKTYVLHTPSVEAAAALPFPDPQLRFGEVDELRRGTGPAARRLAALYTEVTTAPAPESALKKRRRLKRAAE